MSNVAQLKDIRKHLRYSVVNTKYSDKCDVEHTVVNNRADFTFFFSFVLPSKTSLETSWAMPLTLFFIMSVISKFDSSLYLC